MTTKRLFFGLGLTLVLACARTSFKPVESVSLGDQVQTVAPTPEEPSAPPQAPVTVETPPVVPPAPPAPVPAPPVVVPTQPTGSLPTTPSPGTPACVPVASITRLTKILFLVDMSGSNHYPAVVGEHGERTLPPTDPDKKFRIGSIRRFVERFQNKKNFQWGFVTFGGPSATDFILRQTQKSLSADPREILKALDIFQGWNDAGVTPYLKALDVAARALSSDQDQAVKDVQYFVIMLTDGYPTDIKSTDELKKKVKDLLSAVPQKVRLSTVFYGNQQISDSEAALALLQSMAQMGAGQFANVNDTSTGINIEDVIPGHQCL